MVNKIRKHAREKTNYDTNEDIIYSISDEENEYSKNDMDINNLDDNWDFIPSPKMDYTFEEDPEETEKLLQEFLEKHEKNSEIGHVSVQYSTKFKNASSTIPFSKYPHMGPGNEIYPASFNDIDEIARQHDTDYSNAKTVYDVQHADDLFIERMNAIEPKTVGEWVGKNTGRTGIALKYLVERKLGLLYPRITKEPVKYNINPQDIQTFQTKVGPSQFTQPAKELLTGIRDWFYPKKYSASDEMTGANFAIDDQTHQQVQRLHTSYRDFNAKTNREQINFIFKEFEKDVSNHYDELLVKYLYSTDPEIRKHIHDKLEYFDDDMEDYFMKWTEHVPFDKENKNDILYRAYFAISEKEELRYKTLQHKIKYQVLNKYNQINKLHKYLETKADDVYPDIISYHEHDAPNLQSLSTLDGEYKYFAL